MYTFSIPVSVLSNTPPQNFVIPCYFCQVKLFKIPLSHQPERRFTAHELSIQLRLEAIHNWQHRNVCSTFPNGRVDNIAYVKASCASFFPQLANIWASHIQFLAIHVTNPFYLVYPDCKPPSLNFGPLRMDRM